MKTVVFIFGKKALRRYARDRRTSPNVGVAQGVCPRSSGEERRWLEDQGVNCLDLPVWTQQQRETFLKAYLQVVQSLSLHNQKTFLWWATDVSSKNRFTSPLPGLLQEFLVIWTMVRDARGQEVVIYNPSRCLVSSLTKAFQRQGWRCRTLGGLGEGFFTIKAKARCVVRRAGGLVYHGWRLALRAWLARWYLNKHVHRWRKDAAVFYGIKSFFYPRVLSSGVYKDPFFGDLPDFLAGKGRAVFVLTDIQGPYRTSLQRIREAEVPLAPVEFFLNISDLLRAVGWITAFRPRVPEGVRFFDQDITEVLRGALTGFGSAGVALYQVIHYFTTREFLRQVPLNAFLLTYENNPWERMCVAAVREQGKGIPILGYQHAVIPQAAANMFLTRQEWAGMPRPDKILTTGEEPRRILLRYSEIDATCVRPACALRYAYLQGLSPSPRPTGRRVLLALEGIPAVSEMVSYVLRQLNDQPYEITIRPHPVLPVTQLKSRMTVDETAWKRVRISGEISVKEDIQKADVVIYWGTTVALEALSLGRPVIHFDNGSILSYDPLFACRDLKWTVGRQDDLVAVLEEIIQMPPEDYARAADRARAYLKTYFHPVTEENLNVFCWAK